jgi:hypothetical protein
MQPTQYLRDVIGQFQNLKAQADRAMAQVSDEQLVQQLESESNSLAMIVKHVSGNLRSRWTDFLKSDGEKPDRNRDLEFEVESADSRANLVERWENGWHALFEALETMTPADLDKSVAIRNQPHGVVQAINRSLTHTAQHVGQIIFLSKHLAGSNWQTLTIPRGKSAEFDAELQKKHASST